MSSVWYTSDLHFGDRFAAQLRGFDSVEAHDASVIAQWNDQVGSDDVVYVLGDVSLGSPARTLAPVRLLAGRKRLICGNHDRCHPQFRDAAKYQGVYGEFFEWCAPFGRRRINGHDVLLSHYPYTADREDPPRDMQYRLVDYGVPLLHGHTHSDVVRTSPYELHVGWDAWHRLVSEREVERELFS